MAKNSQYVSHEADENGLINWSEEEHAIWRDLYARQIEILPNRACDEFMQGLARLDLSDKEIPQLNDVNQKLMAATGWQVVKVAALINFDEFFSLLADKKFPVATFIRTREEFDYLQEPDIFHEIFGHCPLLTNPAFAHFTHVYGQLGKAATPQERKYLARLYWFTVEFGLLNTPNGTRVYGGGILSSPVETLHSLEDSNVDRYAFNPVEMLRTPYRIDILQTVYFEIAHFDTLFELADSDIMSDVHKAMNLGLKPATFPVKEAS